jgi:demethylmenaquinone methyltransferase / 2-methoxy-6-polyprenyl-1,4-benzoquinol methylase
MRKSKGTRVDLWKPLDESERVFHRSTPVPVSKDPARIAGMFDAIAGRYDALNHLLSGGLDRSWRRRAIRELRLTQDDVLLDMCTGTGDLAIEGATSRHGAAGRVIGIDFAGEMLRLAHAKIRATGLSNRIRLVRGDATRVPLPDQCCEAATVAFGIRNVIDSSLACGEFYRILKSGGRLAILEFGTPQIPGLRQMYGWYFTHVLPRIGRFVSRHGDAYDYLPASVAQFPSADGFAEVLRGAGFTSIRYMSLTFGTVYLYLARKS